MIACLAGFALGAFCAFANYWIVTSPLGQMVTPWVLIAAFVGGKAASAKMAGVWGVTSLVTATVTYYIIAALDRELVTMKYFLIWTVLSLIVGSLFGPSDGRREPGQHGGASAAQRFWRQYR